jgi:tetratricopeptide (TPR) repeat protein/4-amino-4-deoxy-L-arabinose transferase-like glycosyltransferase
VSSPTIIAGYGTNPDVPVAGVRRQPLLIFLAAVFAAKLIVLLQLRDHPLLQANAGLDTTVYTSLASRVLAGNTSLAPGLYFVSPLYIYFLAAAFSVSRSLAFARVIQIALGTAAVWLVFVGARAWFGERAAWIAAVLAALTGLFTFHEVLILQAALDPFLTAAALTALALALTAPRALLWFALSGLAFGLQTLNRPNVLIPCVVVIAMLSIARRWRPAIFMAAGLAIALSPVVIRNLVVAGDWSPASSHGGLNFYIGNNADANGTYHVVPGIRPNIAGQQEDARRAAEEGVGHALDDADVSAYFYGLGWTWIRLHPKDAVALFVRKLGYTFSSAYITLNYSYPFYAYDARTLLALVFVGPWLLIPAGLAGLVMGMPAARRFEYLVWLSFVPVYAVAVAIFFVTERYRLPMLVPLCMASGVTMDCVWSLSRPKPEATRVKNRLQPELFALLAIIPLAILVNWPVHLDDGRAEERTRMAEAMVAQDEDDEAEEWVKKAERDHPSPGVLHFRVARLYILHRKPARAIEHLEKSMQIDRNRPEVDYAYGQALVDAGRPAEAIPHLRNALRAGVRVNLAGYDLARALTATGNRAGALQILQTVKPENAKDAASWDALGELAMQLGSPSLAAAFFNQAIAAAPDNPKPIQDMGLALAMMGRYPEAISNFTHALALDPANAATELNLAVAYAETGRIVDARAHVQAALRLKPDYAKARQFLAALPKGR